MLANVWRWESSGCFEYVQLYIHRENKWQTIFDNTFLWIHYQLWRRGNLPTTTGIAMFPTGGETVSYQFCKFVLFFIAFSLLFNKTFFEWLLFQVAMSLLVTRSLSRMPFSLYLCFVSSQQLLLTLHVLALSEVNTVWNFTKECIIVTTLNSRERERE